MKWFFSPKIFFNTFFIKIFHKDYRKFWFYSIFICHEIKFWVRVRVMVCDKGNPYPMVDAASKIYWPKIQDVISIHTYVATRNVNVTFLSGFLNLTFLLRQFDFQETFEIKLKIHNKTYQIFLCSLLLVANFISILNFCCCLNTVLEAGHLTSWARTMRDMNDPRSYCDHRDRKNVKSFVIVAMYKKISMLSQSSLLIVIVAKDLE